MHHTKKCCFLGTKSTTSMASCMEIRTMQNFISNSSIHLQITTKFITNGKEMLNYLIESLIERDGCIDIH